MSYQVIARKWRPQTFEEVTGQEAITQTLRNAIEFDRLHHAYLFSGARGVGKTTTARLLAKALNCHKFDKPTVTPCLLGDETICASCLEISESRSIDVLEFDAASHTKVEEIRDIILESINVSAARDRYKIFIIDEVHMLSTSSFNALLKTLEEPPPNVVFIMATTELHKVPDTILSRCQEFDFRTIALSKILDRLKIIADAEKIDISEEALREIARSGEGSMRDAQSNFDQVISFSGEKIGVTDVTGALGLASAEMLTRVIKAISSQDRREPLLVVEELISRGQDMRHFCRDLLAFFRDLLVFKIGGESETLLDTAILNREQMQASTADFSETDFLRFFNSLCETESQLKDASQPRYVLEVGLVKLIEMRRVAKVEDLLDRLGKLEGLLQNAPALGDEMAAAAPEKKTLNSEPAALPPTPVERKPEPFSPPPVEQKAEPVKPEPPAIPAAKIPAQDIDPNLDAPYDPGYEPFDDAVPFEPGPPQKPEKPASADVPEPAPKTAVERANAMPVKLMPISAEDLEHIEDKWLDDRYESKLQWSGDDLKPIKGAAELAATLFTATQSPAAQTEAANGNGAAFTRASIDLSFMPSLDDAEDSGEIPVLPANPTDQDLQIFAAKHPTVKRALRVFRGKVVSVKQK